MSKTHHTSARPILAFVLAVATACDAAYDNLPGPENPPGADQSGLTGPQLETAASTSGQRGRRFSVDVVADCNRFTAAGVGHPGANPKFGDYFMQEGLIYKSGTLAKNCAGGDGCGLNPDGSPQFPDQVIGKFTCYGSFVGKGVATTQGTWVYSTQLFEFGAQAIEPNVFVPGEHTLVSLGAERTDLNTPWSRTVSGGTGKFRSAGGEVVQTKIGFNQTTCENFTFDFDIDSSRR